MPQLAWMWSFLTTHRHLQMPQEAQDRSPSKPFNWKFPFAWDRSLSLVRSTKTVQSLNGKDQYQQLFFILLLNFVEYGKCSQLSGFPENTRNHFGKLFSNFSAFAFSFWSAVKLDCSSGKLEAIWFWSVAPSYFWSAPSFFSVQQHIVHNCCKRLWHNCDVVYFDCRPENSYRRLYKQLLGDYLIKLPYLKFHQENPIACRKQKLFEKILDSPFFGTFYLETVSMTSSSSLRVFSQASPRRLN